MRLAAQDTYGVVMVLQAMDAAGKDGTIRHVMSGVNPQGVQVSSFKVPSSRGPQPRLPVALRQEAAGARQHRHLQPLLLRGGPGRPGPPPDPGRPEDPGQAQGPRHLEPALPRDQRLGALPDRPGLPLRQAVPERQQGGAALPVPVAHRRGREELEVQRQRFQGARLLGRLPEGVQRGPLEDQHAVGALVRDPGRRQAVREGRRGRCPGPHPDRHRPALSRRSPRRRATPCRSRRSRSRPRRPPAPPLTPMRQRWPRRPRRRQMARRPRRGGRGRRHDRGFVIHGRRAPPREQTPPPGTPSARTMPCASRAWRSPRA